MKCPCCRVPSAAEWRALEVLKVAGRNGADSTRGASHEAARTWMNHEVNTQVGQRLVRQGLATTWAQLPNGDVVEGEDLVHWLGKYRTWFAIAPLGLQLLKARERSRAAAKRRDQALARST